MIGHDVAIVGERYLANGALSVLLNDFSIEQFPHFRFGAKLAVLTPLPFGTGSRPQQESDR
jgi:hypothetical protein